MTRWWRRIRGALKMGLTWALAWFGAGMALLLVFVAFGVDGADVPFPLGFGMFGFFAGVLFSGVLALVEGRRRFDQMSLPRFAAWGGLGGLLLSVIFVSIATLLGDTLDVVSAVIVFTVAGAGSATGVLALARKAERRELLDAGVEVDEASLTEGETRELHGRGD